MSLCECRAAGQQRLHLCTVYAVSPAVSEQLYASRHDASGMKCKLSPVKIAMCLLWVPGSSIAALAICIVSGASPATSEQLYASRHCVAWKISQAQIVQSQCLSVGVYEQST